MICWVVKGLSQHLLRSAKALSHSELFVSWFLYRFRTEFPERVFFILGSGLRLMCLSPSWSKNVWILLFILNVYIYIYIYIYLDIYIYIYINNKERKSLEGWSVHFRHTLIIPILRIACCDSIRMSVNVKVLR